MMSSTLASPSEPENSITLHALSFSSSSSGLEETLGMFLVGLIVVLILWFTVCCTWFARCGHLPEQVHGKCELLSCQPFSKGDRINWTILDERSPMVVGNLTSQTRTGGLENLSLHVNPFENKRMSSLKITQIDWRLCNTSIVSAYTRISLCVDTHTHDYDLHIIDRFQLSTYVL